MYARVEYKNKEYYSYVFACFDYEYMPQYIVYDPIDKKFDIVALFSKKSYGNRQIGLMNESEKGFIKKQKIEINMGTVYKCVGYDWIINNVELIKDIELGNQIDNKYVKIAEEMNATIDPDGWNEVNTLEDAEEFMYHVGGFHDTYLVGMEAIADDIDFQVKAKLRLRFNSQGPFNILMEFEDGIHVNYSFYSANRIYLSSIVFDGEKKYWVDGDEDISVNDIKKYHYVQGINLRWKFIVKDNDKW